MKDDKCCVVSCEKPLDKDYWDAQYQAEATGWDLGEVSPPLKKYIDTLTNKDLAVLIPGCGNTYEAEYLLKQGFTNITVIDIAPTLVEKLKHKFDNNPNIKIVLADFFDHQGSYDLIIEQTFFCALPPRIRQKYVWKMHQLLVEKGNLVGLLFDREFDISPPFGGSKAEYENLFRGAFQINQMDIAPDSISKRANTELFVSFERRNILVSLYNFQGITCSGCLKTVTEKCMEMQGVENAGLSLDFAELLLVSTEAIPLTKLQELISYDEKYKISKV